MWFYQPSEETQFEQLDFAISLETLTHIHSNLIQLKSEKLIWNENFSQLI